MGPAGPLKVGEIVRVNTGSESVCGTIVATWLIENQRASEKYGLAIGTHLLSLELADGRTIDASLSEVVEVVDAEP